VKSFLVKIWVKSFYRQYAGLFFVVLLILFGFMRGNEHLAIAQFLVGSFENLVYLVFLFLPYGLLLKSFNSRFLLSKENRVVFDLVQIPVISRFMLVAYVIILNTIPLLLYLGFLMVVAVTNGIPFRTLTLLSLALFLILILAIPVYYRLIFPDEKRYGSRFAVPLPTWIKYSFFLLSMKDLFLNRTISVFLSKVLSFMMLFITTIMIPTIDEYTRFISVAGYLTFTCNVFLAWEIHSFIQMKMSFIRNLPVRVSVFWVKSFLITVIFTLPEALFIFRNFHQFLSLAGLIAIVLNGISFLMLINALLLVPGFFHKGFISRLFWLVLVIVFLLLFDAPALLISVFLSGLSFLIYKHYFYRFEQEFTEKK
jgi:hypothetical protein